MTTYTVTDQITNNVTVGSTDELAEVLPTWFEGAPLAEVYTVIDDLLEKLGAHDNTDAEEAYLNIRVELA